MIAKVIECNQKPRESVASSGGEQSSVLRSDAILNSVRNAFSVNGSTLQLSRFEAFGLA